LDDASLDERVSAVRGITATLARLLAEEGVNHRDVKPENLYFFTDRATIGDFGLAKRPDDPNLTEGRPVGPFHHLPSEVFVAGDEPDWERVDVYCLANSLWRLLTNNRYPPRGQIRAGEEDSVALLLPDEPYIGRLASLIEGATSRAPAARPTLVELRDQLDNWLEARRTKDEFSIAFESTEARNLAVLRWLIAYVRSEPVFDAFLYDVLDSSAPSPLSGLSNGEVGDALTDLIERFEVTGEPHHVLGRREPAHYSNLYPTLYGIERVGDDPDVLIAQAAPLLRAFLTPLDWLSLPASKDLVELPGGLARTPAEAYFQMWLLESQGGLLAFTRMREMGGHASFMDVRCTAAGKEWLYRSAGARG
jgi:serine/threonine protein kinase